VTPPRRPGATVRRLFVPRARIRSERVVLEDRELHYLRDVLRLEPGAALEVFDGEGGLHAARLAGGDTLVLAARRAVPRPTARVHLAFALARGERCDLVIQKATELGVARLSPFQAARSVVHLDARRAEERAGRWRRIAAEAARQSERADVPDVGAPVPLRSLLAEPAERVRKIVLHEGGGEPLADVVEREMDEHLLIVGPEGGFSPEEVDACLAAGARLATLGPLILRFETAAIVSVALVRYLAGGLGGPDL
jgi:16S rRNA (uracil1498-N3)-methyltransferase